VQRALAGDPAVADADHVAGTQAAATAERGRAPELTCRSFRAATERTLASLGGPGGEDGQQVAVHGMRLSRGELLVVRAFELWTHENDIRAAVGRPARVPDAATLRSMTDLAVAWLPLGVLRAAPEAGRLDVHLVLTGPGGGTWDLAVGGRGPRPDRETPGVPGVLVVAEAVDFCRLVADRARPDDVVRQVDGHVEDAAVVLAGARALALD
jgi:hypothetical protein